MSSFDNPTLGDNILTEDSRVAQFESYLVYILPPLVTIVLPFSSFNIYVLNVTNRMGSSSHFLYLNILSTDILTALSGIFIVIHIKNKDEISFWLFKNMIWLSFYTAVPLLFGLVTVRILSRHLEISKWVAYGLRIAKIVTVLSWCTGLGVATLHNCYQFGRVGSEIKNSVIMCVVVLTCVMNLYVWITLKRVRHESSRIHRATVTALVLFLNFMLYYAYVTAVNIFSIYALATGSSACSTSSWVGLLLCSNKGRHELGNCFLMLHGIGNNLILVCRNFRMARIVVQYHVRTARDWFSGAGGDEGQPLIS